MFDSIDARRRLKKERIDRATRDVAARHTTTRRSRPMRAAFSALFARKRKRGGDDDDGDGDGDGGASSRGGGAPKASAPAERLTTMTTTSSSHGGTSASSAFAWRGSARTASPASTDGDDGRGNAGIRAFARERGCEGDAREVRASEGGEKDASEDELAVAYVADAFEAPRNLTEVAFESNVPSMSAATREVFGDTCRGLRCTEDIEVGTTVMELDGPAHLITAQQCARDKSLTELLRYWLLLQTSSRMRTLVDRDQLREWQRNGVIADYAPWARESDFVGSGFVVNPTVEPIHLPLDEMVLSCFMVLERRKGKTSKWHDYISALPTLEDFRRDVPLFIPLREFVQFFGYIECERAHAGKLLSDVDLRWMIAERRHAERLTELTFRHIVSKVAFRSETSGNRFTFERTYMTREEFLWGYGVVMTRAFQSPNPVSGDPWMDMLKRKDFVGTFLAPYLDFANHKRPREVEYVTTGGQNGNGKVVVRALRNFNAGDYLHISYGAKSNLDLFMRYGFAVEDNTEPDGSSNDMFRVDLDDFSRVVRKVPMDVPIRGQEIFVRFAQTTTYMYAAFDKILDVARAHFTENNPKLKAALIEAEREEIIRDDAIWNCDEDVYGGQGDDEALNDMLYGDDDNEDDNEDEHKDGTRHPSPSSSRRVVAVTRNVDSPDVVALKREVEIKALREVRDYMLVEHAEPKPSSSSRDALFSSLLIVHRSRRRTFDVYAMAAHLAADALDAGDAAAPRARARSSAAARRALPRHVKAMLARREQDDTWRDAARVLADAHIARVDAR